MKKTERKQAKPDSPPSEPAADAVRLIGFIGGYLIDQGTLTLRQLDEALLYQLRRAEAGEMLSLADVLLRLKMATRVDIARAERRMRNARAARP